MIRILLELITTFPFQFYCLIIRYKLLGLVNLLMFVALALLNFVAFALALLNFVAFDVDTVLFKILIKVIYSII